MWRRRRNTRDEPYAWVSYHCPVCGLSIYTGGGASPARCPCQQNQLFVVVHYQPETRYDLPEPVGISFRSPSVIPNKDRQEFWKARRDRFGINRRGFMGGAYYADDSPSKLGGMVATLKAEGWEQDEPEPPRPPKPEPLPHSFKVVVHRAGRSPSSTLQPQIHVVRVDCHMLRI